MEAVARLAIEHDLWVLSDEAYFEMRYAGESTSIASLPGMKDRTVILYTFSKKFAMTGWRLGAAIAPIEVAEQIAKLNTNDESCTAHFVQWAGVEGITGDQSGPAALRDVLRVRRDAAVDGVNAIPGIAHGPTGSDLLPVRQRDRGDGGQGVHRRRELRDRGPAPDRRVVLHPPTLRTTTTGRGAAVHPARVLGHLRRRHHRGARSAGSVGDGMSAPLQAGHQLGKVVVTGRIPIEPCQSTC